MGSRLRFVLFAACALPAASACNALLGITELNEPLANDGGGLEADVPDTTVPTGDAGADADGGAPCAAGSSADPCIIIELQDGGSIFATWGITSDRPVLEQGSTIAPTFPAYSPVDSGTVTEAHSKLTWQTAYRDGGAGDNTFDYAAAVAACQALGPGWRLPSRIELATTQYRVTELLSGFRTVCIPPEFDQNEVLYAWSSTSTPAAVGGATDLVYVSSEVACGFVSVSKTTKHQVRCVNGDVKPATFIVSKSTDRVHAVDTGLVWERTGIVVKTWAEASSHCQALGMRIPVIQELYSIIDTRTPALFQAEMFVRPTLDAGASTKILSQTVYAVDSADGGVPTYEAVSTINSPWGDENGVSVEEAERNVLVRCVATHVP